MTKFKNNSALETQQDTVNEDSVSENRFSENEKLIRNKNSKKNLKHIQDTESTIEKPPLNFVDGNSSSIILIKNDNSKDARYNGRLTDEKKISNKITRSENAHMNEAYESDNSVKNIINNKKDAVDTLNEKKNDKKRRKRKGKINIENTVYHDDQILAVVVHESGKLRTDVNIYHPMVRVHLLDLDTDGHYVKKKDRNRHVNCFYEKENSKIDYIMPIMTTPFDFKTHKTLVPKWEEILIFNETFDYFVQDHPKVLVMFEILDTLRTPKISNNYPISGKDSGWQRIAWAFLKLVGSDKSLNIEKKIRLQLFYSQTQFRENFSENTIPEVYTIFKNGPRIAYPSTIYVTVKSIIRPKTFAPCLRSFYAFQQEIAPLENTAYTNKIDDMKTETNDSIKQIYENDGFSLEEDQKYKKKSLTEKKTLIWSRLPGQPCRIPNDLLLNLNSGKNGCYSIRFSKSGSFLACGCTEESKNSPIAVYEIPDGKLAATFLGHFGLIYDLDWSIYDKYLLSSSNDATARVYNMNTKSKDAFKILPHPTFVYSAKFHPLIENIICSGGYDRIVRVWYISNSGKYGSLIQELNHHNGYINSICFNENGTKFYSADSNGKIMSWNSNSKIEKEWNLDEVINIDELKNQCINHIELHNSQRRMIVHTRDNQLRLIDIRIQAVIQRYSGTLMFNDFMRSTLTPCGTFLFTSGADTKAYCWNVETGDLVTTNGMHLSYFKQARDLHYHPFDNMIAMCSYGAYSPIFVYKYNPDKSDLMYSDQKTENSNTKQLVPPITVETSINAIETLPNFVSNDDLVSIQRMPKETLELQTEHEKQNSFRWKKVQNQLDSVYTNIAQLNVTTPKITKKHITDVINSPRTNYNNLMTLSVTTNDRTEFRYNGPKETQDLVVALYDYKAQRSDELNLRKGDEIFVLVKDSPSWWMGETVETRQQGYFPSSYVQDKKTIPKLTVKDVMNKYNKFYENPLNISTTINSKAETVNEIPTKDRQK